MPKITEFTKPLLKSIIDDLSNHLKEVEREWGVRIEFRGGKFDTLSFTPRIEITIADAQGGKSYAKERRAWEVHARYCGLQHGWLDRKFTSRGKTFTVAGFMPRRRSKPVLLLDDAGKCYHAPIEMIQLHLRALDKVA